MGKSICTDLKKEIYEELRMLISVQLDIKTNDVKPNARIVDLGADSLDMVELAFAAEDAFEIEIPDDGLWNGKFGTKTVKDAVDYIFNRTMKKR